MNPFSKIDLIKYVRNISTPSLGLVTAKTLVEFWMDSVKIDGSPDVGQIMLLSLMVNKVSRGEWVERDGKFCVEKNITYQDVLDLRWY